MAKLTKPVIKKITSQNISANSISIHWDMDPGATSYTVNIFKGSVSAGNKVSGYPKTSSGPDTHVITGLPGSTKYIFRIQAVSATPADTSDFSDDVSATTKAAKVQLAKPVVTLGSITSSSITATWSAVPYATDYMISLDGSPFMPATSPKVITPINPNTEIKVKVKAEGSSTFLESISNEKKATTLAVATPMVITIPGNNPIDVVQGSAFTVPTATVQGGTSATVTANPTSIVTTGGIGTEIQIEYKATDSGTPKATDVTKVLLVKIVAPKKVYSIRLKGSANSTNSTFEAQRGTFGHEVDENGAALPRDQVFVDKGAEVVDASNTVDSNLSKKIKTAWNPAFDPHKVNHYVCTYTLSAADNPTGGVKTATRTVDVKDTTKPLIKTTLSAVNVAKGFDITTILPTTGISTDDNADGTVTVTSSDAKVGNVTTRTFTATDAANNFSTVSTTITELDDLNVSVPDINLDTHATSFKPVPSVPNAIGTVTYSYSPPLNSVKLGVAGKTEITVTATEDLTPYGARTGTSKFFVEITAIKVDHSNDEFLDGKALFMSNYSKNEGKGPGHPNDDNKIDTVGTEYEKDVHKAKLSNLSPQDAVWFDESAMDPYERRIVADETKKPY